MLSLVFDVYLRRFGEAHFESLTTSVNLKMCVENGEIDKWEQRSSFMSMGTKTYSLFTHFPKMNMP
jgi:hypothetical protein